MVCSIARGEEGVGEVGKDDNGEGEVVESVGVSLGVQWTIAEACSCASAQSEDISMASRFVVNTKLEFERRVR